MAVTYYFEANYRFVIQVSSRNAEVEAEACKIREDYIKTIREAIETDRSLLKQIDRKGAELQNAYLVEKGLHRLGEHGIHMLLPPYIAVLDYTSKDNLVAKLDVYPNFDGQYNARLLTFAASFSDTMIAYGIYINQEITCKGYDTKTNTLYILYPRHGVKEDVEEDNKLYDQRIISHPKGGIIAVTTSGVIHIQCDGKVDYLIKSGGGSNVMIVGKHFIHDYTVYNSEFEKEYKLDLKAIFKVDMLYVYIKKLNDTTILLYNTNIACIYNLETKIYTITENFGLSPKFEYKDISIISETRVIDVIENKLWIRSMNNLVTNKTEGDILIECTGFNRRYNLLADNRLVLTCGRYLKTFDLETGKEIERLRIVVERDIDHVDAISIPGEKDRLKAILAPSLPNIIHVLFDIIMYYCV